MQTPDIVALIIITLLGVSLWRVHRDPSSSINIFDLVLEGGRLGKLACAYWAVFGVLSWAFVKLVQAGEMTHEYFAAYGALFVAPIIVKMFATPAPPGTTTTTTASQKTTEVT